MRPSARISAILIFIFFQANNVKADITQPGVIRRQFQVANTDKFPGYKFFYIFQGFHYDRGYQPNTPDTLPVVNNERYFAASRGGHQTILLAKDSKGRLYRSTISMGGEANVSEQVSGLVDAYQVLSIKNGKIQLKKTELVTVYTNGEEKSRKVKAGILAYISSDKFTGGLTAASIAALMGLLVMFILRRKKQQSAAQSLVPAA